MFVYHFIFRGFMLTLQKKFKKGLLATVFAFTLAQSPAHAVEKPNFMPAQCLGVAGITAVVMGGLLNPEHLRGLIEEKAIDAWIAKNGLNQYGESKETLYYDKVNGPLANGQSRISYIKAKCLQMDDESWKNGYVRMLDYVNNLELTSTVLACGGISLVLISVLVAAVLDVRYTNARWTEQLAQWKTEGIELEKKLVADISAAVVAGIAALSAS